VSAPDLVPPGTTGGGTPVGGSGTIGTVPKWGTTSTLNDSVITQSGTNVGVNVPVPTFALAVESPTSTILKLSRASLNGFTASVTGVMTGTGAGDLAWDTVQADGGYAWRVNNSATFAMGIDETGRVGIGTTSPATKLQVTTGTDTIFFDPSFFTSTGLLKAGPSTGGYNNFNIDAFSIRFFESGVERMRVHNGGNVGIGTASPSGRLHVVGGTAAAATNGAPVTIIAQTAGSGNQNGGNIVLTPGALSGSGTAGLVDLSGPTGTGLKLPSSPGNADTQTLDCYNEIATQTTGATFTTLTLVSTGAAPTSYSITTTRIGKTVNILVSVSSSGSVFAGTAGLCYVNLSGVTGIPTGTLDVPVPICHNGTAAIAGNTGIWYASTREILFVDPSASGGPTTIIFALTTYIA